jgi:hypothetical protein
VLPTAEVYPTVQAVQLPPPDASPVYPAGQMQLPTAVLPTAEVASMPQPVHAAGPDVSLWLPAGQAVQSLPSSPVYPTGQATKKQSLAATVPTAEKYPGVHGVHGNEPAASL